MNRISNEYMAGRRNIPAVSIHRREKSLTGIPKERDENLDLFSRNRRSFTIASPDQLDITLRLERISVGSAKLVRSGKDDLLSSVDGGKHDYDWLLTPPGTPLFTSSDASEPQPTEASRRSGSMVRSVSTTKASRLSVTQSENSYTSRPTRSSSVTRPSISTASYNTYSSNSNRSSMLNTSMSSVTSISRPSTPNSRSTRPSTPSAHSISSRPSTSIKSRPLSTSFCGERTRTSQSPRPSTPTSRPQIPGNLNSLVPRSNSRPSTPTRRSPTPSLAPVTGRSASAGRVISNDRNGQPTSRGSSPGSRARPVHQPIVLPDFPLDIPPNLRTTLPDRPISAGRSRPGATTATARGNSEATGLINPQRRQSSPVITRGRLPELSGKNRSHSNGYDNGAHEDRKMIPANELPQRRATKSATATENTGYGRTISKRSLDPALRHMDIRPGSGNIRPVSGSTLFPQSIRNGKTNGRSPHILGTQAYNGGPPISNYVGISKNGNYIDRPSDGEYDEEVGHLTHFSARLSDPDIYESSRYNAILFAEDLKSTNWLHSFDQSEQGSMFDHRFEPLPEPFGPL